MPSKAFKAQKASWVDVEQKLRVKHQATYRALYEWKPTSPFFADGISFTRSERGWFCVLRGSCNDGDYRAVVFGAGPSLDDALASCDKHLREGAIRPDLFSESGRKRAAKTKDK